MAWAADWLSNLALFKDPGIPREALYRRGSHLLLSRGSDTAETSPVYDAWRIIAANEGKPWDTV